MTLRPRCPEHSAPTLRASSIFSSCPKIREGVASPEARHSPLPSANGGLVNVPAKHFTKRTTCRRVTLVPKGTCMCVLWSTRKPIPRSTRTRRGACIHQRRRECTFSNSRGLCLHAVVVLCCKVERLVGICLERAVHIRCVILIEMPLRCDLAWRCHLATKQGAGGGEATCDLGNPV